MSDPKAKRKKRGRYRSYLHEDISPSKVPKRTKRRYKENSGGSPSDIYTGKTDHTIVSHEEYSLLETTVDYNVASSLNTQETSEPEDELASETVYLNGELGEESASIGISPINEFLSDEDWDKFGNAVFDTDIENNEEKGEKDEAESDEFVLDEIIDNHCDDYEEKDQSTDPPLYNGSALTVSMHVIAILTFAMAQSLTATAMAHLLVLIYLHCPTPNNCVKSMHMLWNHFRSVKAPIEWHYLCSRCKTYIGKDKPLPSEECCNCKGSFKDGKFKSWETFITFPITCQLKSMLETTSFVEALTTYRFEHNKSKLKRNVTDNIEDIIDGQNYQTFFKHPDGFLRNPNNMSFQLNTDGVALFKSSTFSIWPVYLVICDLPPKLRYSRKYRLFVGLWFGYTKPIFSTFLRPFKDMFQQLYVEGFKTLKSKDSDVELTWRGIVISSSMDAPAKCLYMCMKQFNGECGCPYCKAKGKNLRTEQKGNCRIYPYINVQNRQTEAPLRDHKDFLHEAKKARDRKMAGEPNPEINGVRSASIAFGFPGYDIVAGTAIDYMHTVLLGIMKQLLTYWFDKKHRKSMWYCGKSIKTCDYRRANIKPPSQVSRIPRSLEERGHYKASELRTWLLYYSLPVMQGILPETHYQHLMLLICAIYILLKQSISPQDLKKARLLLEHFCLRASSMYNERFQTFNLHQLLHLTDCVKNNGPLWACSCFFYEDLNGDLRSLFHGSQNVEEQIIRSVAALQHIPEIMEKMQESQVKQYCQSIMTKKDVGYVTDIIDEKSKIYVIGCLKSLQITNSDEIDQLQIAAMNTAIFDIEYRIFYRLKIDKDIVHSKGYQRVTKRDSTVVEFNKEDDSTSYGSVKYFVEFKTECSSAMCTTVRCTCKTKKYIAMIDEYEKEERQLESSGLKGPKAKISHLIPVKRNRTILTFIFVNQIVQSCFYIDTGSGSMYIGIPPNSIERE